MGKLFSRPTLRSKGKKKDKDNKKFSSTLSLPAGSSTEVDFNQDPNSSETSKRSATKTRSLPDIPEALSANEKRPSNSRSQSKQTSKDKQLDRKRGQPTNEEFKKVDEELFCDTKPQQTAIALYDYQPIYADDLTFKKGDKMTIISNEGEDSEWWRVRHLDSNSEGCVPSNFVTLDDNNTDYRGYYFELSRDEAEQQLLILPGNEPGSYLIRPNSAESDTTSVLSLLYEDDDGKLSVAHYKICKTNENFYYIANRRDTTTPIPFRSISDLIKHFTDDSGLVRRLTKPCPKELSAMPLKDFEIDRQDITIGDELGSGNFGKVYAGKFRDRIDIAIKELKTGSAMSPEEFQQEARTMHKLRHPRLVRLLGLCTTGSPACIVMERLSKGSLIQILRDKDAKRDISFKVLMRMAYQIADGMSYLEMKKFVHRDLRAANILVGDNNLVKIADFGLAYLLDYYYGNDSVYKETKDKNFPYKWTALEALKKEQYTTMSDVWSFGILLYELITYGNQPYAGFANQDVVPYLEDGKRLPKPRNDDAPHCPPELYAIMKECWDKDPIKRPTFIKMKKKLSNFLPNDKEFFSVIEN